MNNLFLSLLLLLTSADALAVKAFPGAEGAGANSVGGRGGTVIMVTNLADAGTGSLRACVQAVGPRTCIFRVGGTITLTSVLNIVNPFLTIAGQTAPGGGIQLRGHSLGIGDPAHDIIIRYIRSRRGLPAGGTDGKGLDIVSYGSYIYNLIIDHCSFGWQQDDNSTWFHVRDETIQRSIFAEGYNADGSLNGTNGKGLLLGAPIGSGDFLGLVSVHHNFLSSNFQRNPTIDGAGPNEIVNNVIYNWGPIGAEILNGDSGVKANYIGNFFKAGPSTGSGYELVIWTPSGNVIAQPPGLVYMSDNRGPHRTSSTQAEGAFVGNYPGGGLASTAYQKATPWPVSPTPITISPSTTNVTNVLNDVGANMVLSSSGAAVNARDAVDTRLVNEYNAGTGSVAGDNNFPVLAAGTAPPDADLDGMPDAWESAHAGLSNSNPSDRNGDTDGDGYTNLEEFLMGPQAGAVPQGPVALPEGNGLAAAYPSDTGISANANVLYADGFETYTSPGQLTSSGNWDNFYQGANIAFDTTTFFDGTKAIRLRMPSTGSEVSNAIVKTISPSRDKLFMRVYTRFQPTYAGMNSAHNGIRMTANYTGPGVRPNGSDFFLVNVENSGQGAEGEPGYTHAYVYHPEQDDVYGENWYSDGTVTNGTANFGSFFVPRTKTLPVRGDWISHEVMVQANTAGQRDGRVAYWQDGVLMADWQNVRFRDVSTLKINEIQLENGGQGSTQQNDKWYDNLVIATSYIGPMAASAPALPDVIVTSLSYSNGVFTSTVKNQGTVATPLPGTTYTIGVGYFVDGVARASGFVNGPLAAGASVAVGTTSAQYTIPSGNHTITAFVDDVNRFPESDEGNNQLSQAITVGVAGIIGIGIGTDSPATTGGTGKVDVKGGPPKMPFGTGTVQ